MSYKDLSPAITELRPQDADIDIRAEQLHFNTTDELDALDDIVGQPRALKALDIGLGIRHPGYNVYVSGMSGMGKKEMIRRALAKRVNGQPAPPDWVYVNNFESPERPLAIGVKPGEGNRLKRGMNELIESLKDDIPKAFRQEDFSKEKQRLAQEYEVRGKQLYQTLEQIAQEKGLIIQQAEEGRVYMVPRKNGEPMPQEEFETLPDDRKEEINTAQKEAGEKASGVFARYRDLGRKLSQEVRNVEREFGARLINPAIDQLAGSFENNDKLKAWFESVKQHLVDNLNRFREREGGQQQQLAAMLGIPAGGGEKSWKEYDVNVVVDNSAQEGAPVILEDSPNYKNLFGTIHGSVDRAGRMSADFTQIAAGSLLKANGGYLVLNLVEAIMESLVWKELKRTIKSCSLEYHMYDPFGVFATSALRPEPIPLDIKLVVIGNPLVYHLLHLYDEDFPEIFKIKAEFSSEIDRTDGFEEKLGQFVQKLRSSDSVMPFSAPGVVELVRMGARLAGDKTKITGEFSKLADIAREASYWAREAGAETVTADHVRKAVDEKIYRSNVIAEKIRELISNGTLIIDLDGSVVGQVNGLSVIQLGDYAFGKPSRLTASVGVGSSGIVNIERESKLSGRSFDKAMLILEGYLRNKYAAHQALALSASLAMEQSYGMVEGDSATAAELVCLLSALSGIPLRQDIAITGSVNQWGRIQAVGGVSEKTEGFFDVCKHKGLTGKQGVCIPASNVRNLVLRPDVINAMREGAFHVWAIESLDQALALLGGASAGDIHEKGTFHYQTFRRLKEISDALKRERALPGVNREITHLEHEPRQPRDPRPPLPGRDEPGC